MANELEQAMRSISKAVDQAGVASLNRALSAGQTLFQRTIRQTTGLNTKQIGSRIFSSKATAAKPSVYAAAAVGVGINAKYFKPQAIIVTGTNPKSGRPQNYRGVTIKIGNQPRYILPNAFLAKVSNGELIPLVRKDLSITKHVKENTRAIYLDVIRQAATDAQAPSQQAMSDSFEANLQKLIAFYVGNKRGLSVIG